MTETVLSIALIDPLPLRRAAFAAMLATWAPRSGVGLVSGADLDAVGCEETGTRPNLVLVNLGGLPLSSSEGRERVAAMAKAHDGALAVIVDTLSPACVAVAFDLGLRGAIRTSETPEVVFAALTFIAAGGCYIPHARDTVQDPRTMSYLPQGIDEATGPDHAEDETVDNSDHDLTPRQYDVLAALAEGASNKEIARTLDLSEATVKSHIRQVMRKLKAQNRTQAALLARDLRRQTRSRAFLPPSQEQGSREAMVVK
ncbi:response regulator transcription factor [Roseivivax marinus]|uniref:helix-turn-helix transcriptional regulator n=1 Tax=Roseivivax marinus TaxID=1379903 RepID=UPI001F0340EF|nr:response regulator transcription factor [Roseivivax marinus]UMA64583.1 response regulator transcription factor [Roseivivax marinus]